MTVITATPEAIQLHNRINQTQIPYEDTATLCEVWNRTAANAPEAPALSDDTGTLSYRALDRLANGLAAQLRAENVKPSDVVMIALPRGRALIIALLAVLKAGGAYLPVDCAWPAARITELANEAGATLCLGSLPAPITGLTEHRVDPNELCEIEQAPPITATPDSTAYINYTSGSTGRPKGVPTHHRAILRLVQNPSFMRLTPQTRMLHMAPVCFDAATLEIWGPLLNGGTCVLYPNEMLRLSKLRRIISQHNLSAIFLTTAIFNMIMDDAPEILAPLIYVMTGGEAHSLHHIDTGFHTLGPKRLISVYGPTESTTFASFYPITRARRTDETALPIGKPIQNTRAYIIRDGHLAELGETGEICLAGPGLSHGYLGKNSLSAEKFTTITIGKISERIYKTGDLGYLNTSGDIVFQGRSDDQVKINGNRIELGEIQHHLLALPDVQKATSIVHGDTADTKQIIAFVILSNSKANPDLRATLAKNLPAFLVPNKIIALDRFPLTPTGKIDKKSLKTLLEA